MQLAREFPSTFEGLVQLAETLRGPGGCNWDKVQTVISLKGLFLEECYEFLEAIDTEDVSKVVAEMGDVLFHMALQICLAKEGVTFDQVAVFSTAVAKLVRRHPHVFGDSDASSIDDIKKQWKDIKRTEVHKSVRSTLGDVPQIMPALLRARALQERAAEAGFDWEDVYGVLDKIKEEVSEFCRAKSSEDLESELGDIIFSLVNLGRWADIDSEGALRSANSRFQKRFELVEQLCAEKDISLDKLTQDQREELWHQVKKATE